MVKVQNIELLKLVVHVVQKTSSSPSPSSISCINSTGLFEIHVAYLVSLDGGVRFGMEVDILISPQQTRFLVCDLGCEHPLLCHGCSPLWTTVAYAKCEHPCSIHECSPVGRLWLMPYYVVRLRSYSNRSNI